MKISSPRLTAIAVVPLATLLAGLASGYYAGRLVPSNDWIFGQFADRIALAERARSGDHRSYELIAIPSIALMSLQLDDAGFFHANRSSPQVEEFRRRALQLLEQAGGDVAGTQLHADAIASLRSAQPEAPAKVDRGG